MNNLTGALWLWETVAKVAIAYLPPFKLGDQWFPKIEDGTLIADSFSVVPSGAELPRKWKQLVLGPKNSSSDEREKSL